jgi:hypothetical protein
MKNNNHIIVRLMENGKCIHAHEIKNLYGELAKYTKESFPNEGGGYTTIVEVDIQNPFTL